MDDGNYCIYCHTNKTNGKRYIGLTGDKPEERWRNGHAYKGNKYLTSAFQKYGFDGFYHDILIDGLTKEEAEKLEIEYIAKFNSNQREFGYNIQNGGNSTGRIGEESKIKISNSLKEFYKNNPNPMQGKHQSEESNKKNMLSQPNRKEVVKIDLETKEILNIYPSVNEAARCNNTTIGAISSCCNGRYGSVHGFLYQFVGEPHKYVHKDTKEKPVAQIDIKTGEVIATYKSAADAHRVTGINNIDKVANPNNSRHKTAGGFIWKYI